MQKDTMDPRVDPAVHTEYDSLRKAHIDIFKKARERKEQVYGRYAEEIRKIKVRQDLELAAIEQDIANEKSKLQDLEEFIAENPSDAQFALAQYVFKMVDIAHCHNCEKWDRFGPGWYIHITKYGFPKTTLMKTETTNHYAQDSWQQELESHGFHVHHRYLSTYIGPN